MGLSWGAPVWSRIPGKRVATDHRKILPEKKRAQKGKKCSGEALQTHNREGELYGTAKRLPRIEISEPS